MYAAGKKILVPQILPHMHKEKETRQALIYGAGYVRVFLSCHTKVTKATGTINRNET
jgi:hypothetical protein